MDEIPNSNLAQHCPISLANPVLFESETQPLNRCII